MLPPGNPLGGQGPVTLEQLVDVPFISSAPGTRARTLLDKANEQGIALRTVLETPHREAVVPMIPEGVGAAFLPWTVSREAERRGPIVLSLLPAVT